MKILRAGLVFLLLMAFPLAAQAQLTNIQYTTTPDGNGGLVITGFSASGSGPLTIASSINGLIVTGIGADAAGVGAFQGKTNLTSVTIPGSVTSIGNYAFANSSLTGVMIPGSVTSVGNYAFASCGLTSVAIPGSVTTIGVDPFGYCPGLTSITVSAQNPAYISGADGVLFDKNQSTLIQCPAGKTGDYTIPTGVTSIGVDAFNGCLGLTSVTIPTSVTGIGDGALSYCKGLSSVVIPASVTSLGTNVFNGCSNLSSVTIPTSVTSIGDYDFMSCTSLTSVTLPASVTSIGAGVFSYCSSLTALAVDAANPAFSNSGDGVLFDKNQSTLILYPAGKAGSYTVPATVTSIGSSAFWGCTGLTSVTLPASVTSIGYQAFDYCSSLANAVFQGNAPTMGGDVFANTANGFVVDYYNGATGFASPTWTADVLDSYPAVNSGNAPSPFTTTSDGSGGLIITGYTGTVPPALDIPGTINGLTVTGIGMDAFYGARATSVTIPNSVTSIGDGAFGGWASLTSVTIPNSVTSIGNNTFGYCTSLTSVSIGTGVTSIGFETFQNCTSLAGVTLPPNVTSIGPDSFQNCSSLTSVTIPSGVTSIGDFAFNGCPKLTSVTIPASVTSIGQYAFAEYALSSSGSMTSAVFLGNAPTMGTGVFQAAASGFTVQYYNGATGFTSPTWTDTSGDQYPAALMDPFSGGSLGSGWCYSCWFGTYNSNYYPWIYRTDLGFIYVDTSDNTNLYLYVVNGGSLVPGAGASMGWLYSNQSVFPNVYSFSKGAWLYYAAGGTSFYNYNTQAWETY